jgi:hypothetical protein
MEKKAIIVSGCRKLIGTVDLINEDCKDLGECEVPGLVVKIRDAVEFRIDGVLSPSPDGMGLMFQHIPAIVPLDLEEKPVDISVRVDSIRFFDEMEDKGRRYDSMLADFEQRLIQARAAKAGIIPANTMPKQKSKITL